MDSHVLDPIRFIAIDPGGSNNLGVAVMELNPSSRQITVPHVFTARMETIARDYPEVSEMFGDRAARFHAVGKTISSLITAWAPAFVVIEEAHFRRFGQGNVMAFASLTECVATVRQAVIAHPLDVAFFSLPASTVKKGVGVKGNSNDKDLMTSAIARLGLHPDPSSLDEHSVDAIAIGYTQILRLYPPISS